MIPSTVYGFFMLFLASISLGALNLCPMPAETIRGVGGNFM